MRSNFTSGSSWTAEQNNIFQWIQADLGDLTVVTSIQTQGRQDLDQWVASYKISTEQSNGSLVFIETEAGDDRIFAGNTDADTVVTNDLPAGTMTTAVRLHPVKWQGWISMRWEVTILNPCGESYVKLKANDLSRYTRRLILFLISTGLGSIFEIIRYK